MAASGTDDLDDGFDVDELDAGSILGQVVLATVNDNFEEGLDFNENHAGDLRVNLLLVDASGNREEGIDYEEDDDFAGGGNLVTAMAGIRANGNGVDGGDAGIKIREKGEGDLRADVNGVETNDNVSPDSGDDMRGLQVREDAAGSLVASVTNVQALRNEEHGIDVDENAPSGSETAEPAGGGNLTVALRNATALDNAGGFDIRADEAGAGAGTFSITNVTYVTAGGNVPPTVTP